MKPEELLNVKFTIRQDVCRCLVPENKKPNGELREACENHLRAAYGEKYEAPKSDN